MGGIAINYKGEAIINKGSGDQAIPGLHAAGEAVSNCHGANRLGANSILDVDLGFGKAIGINIGCIATPGDKQPELKHNICDASIDNLEKVKALKGSVFPHDLRLNMRTTMQNKCGVFREAKLLDEAQEEIQKWYAAFKDLKITDQKKNFNTDLIESLELQNMLRAAVQSIIREAASLVGEREQIDTWDNLKLLLSQHFGDPRSEDCLAMELDSLKKDKNESHLDFCHRVQHLRSILFSKINETIDNPEIRQAKQAIYNNSALNVFLFNLPAYLVRLVRLRNVTTLEDALKTVLEEQNFQTVYDRKTDKDNQSMVVNVENENSNSMSFSEASRSETTGRIDERDIPSRINSRSSSRTLTSNSSTDTVHSADDMTTKSVPILKEAINTKPKLFLTHTWDKNELFVQIKSHPKQNISEIYLRLNNSEFLKEYIKPKIKYFIYYDNKAHRSLFKDIKRPPQVTPIPITKSSKTYTIIPKYPYLLVNGLKYRNVLSPCESIEDNKYLCSEENMATDNEETCIEELMLIKNNYSLCHQHQIRIEKLKIQKIMNNSWLIFTADKIILSEHCRNDVRRFSLLGTYVVTPSQGCNMQIGRTIFGQSSNVSDVNIQMPLVVIPELQEDLATADKKLDLTNVDFSDVKEMLNNVRNSNSEIVVESVVTHNISVWTLVLYFIVVIIVIVIILKFKLYSICNKRNSPKSPLAPSDNFSLREGGVKSTNPINICFASTKPNVGRASATTNTYPLPFLYSCARNRTESRGAHFRDDFPKREDEMDYSKPTEGQTAKPIEKHWRKHSISNLDLATGKVTISYRPVIDKTLDDEVQTIPPVPRVY
ncbi:unnamed protein product [Pieris macdunnoughi]|uniref:Uncharacterized protein n=1 Tax=Pieris macdunnoughi TaxID=345717 RepID=A0A821W5I3_9NEOP|nr:unnamed protein product [Pieris macdunnoughi]